MCGNMIRQLMLIFIVFATIEIGPIYAESDSDLGFSNSNVKVTQPTSTPSTPTPKSATTTTLKPTTPGSQPTTTSPPTPGPTNTTTVPSTTTIVPTTAPNTTIPPTTTTKPTTPTPSTNTTTPNPTPITTSPSQVTTVPPKPTAEPSKDRHFDGPSFIGGIVLSVGIMAIAFVSWKFYKARSERNYHTL